MLHFVSLRFLSLSVSESFVVVWKDIDNIHCRNMTNHLADSVVDYYYDNDWNFSKFLKRRKTQVLHGY